MYVCVCAWRNTGISKKIVYHFYLSFTRSIGLCIPVLIDVYIIFFRYSHHHHHTKYCNKVKSAWWKCGNRRPHRPGTGTSKRRLRTFTSITTPGLFHAGDVDTTVILNPLRHEKENYLDVEQPMAAVKFLKTGPAATGYRCILLVYITVFYLCCTSALFHNVYDCIPCFVIMYLLKGWMINTKCSGRGKEKEKRK